MTEAHLPDGRVLEFPDNTPPEVIQRTVKKVLGKEQPGQSGLEKGLQYFNDLTNSVASGMTFGLADEAGALGTAAGRVLKGEAPDYEGALNEERTKAKQFAQENPVTDVVANVAGGFGNPLAKAFSGGGSLLATTGKAAAAGSTMGGLYGAGNAEGDLTDRAIEGTIGAVAGGAIGAAAVPLLAALGKGVNASVKAIKAAADRSGTTTSQIKIAQAVKRLGDGDMKKGIAIVRSRIQKGGPDTVLADVLDIGGQRTVRGAANVPGAPSAQVDNFIAKRVAGRGDRLQNAADILGKNTYHESLEKISQTQSAKARPLYEKAFAPISNKDGKVFAQWDDELQRFLQQSDVKKGMAAGIKNIEREAVGRGEPFNYQEFAVKGFDDAGNIIIEGTPNLRAMDAAKRGLDAMIEAEKDSITGKLTTKGRSLDILRKGLVDKLDDITTDEAGYSAYKAARETWAGPQKLLDAARDGRKFIRDDFEMTAKKLAQLTPEEQEAFRLGVRREMSKMIDTDTQAALNKFAPKKRDFWNKLEAVFPDKKTFNQFRFKIGQEARKQRTEQFISPRGGSHTTPMAEDIDDLASVPKAQRPLVEAVSHLLRGNAGQAISSAGKPVFDKLSTPNQKVAIQILNKMLTSGQSLAEVLPARLKDTVPPEAIEAASRAITAAGSTRR